MLGGEIVAVDKAHGLVEAGMLRRLGGLFLAQTVKVIDQFLPRIPERFQELVDIEAVEIGFLGAAVVDIGGTQLRFAGHEIVETAVPQLLHHHQVPHGLLDGPLVAVFLGESFSRQRLYLLLQAGGAAAQSFHHHGVHLDGEVENKLAVEPYHFVSHCVSFVFLRGAG